jgi:hypothetical protein
MFLEDLSMIGVYAWAALAALSFVAVSTLIEAKVVEVSALAAGALVFSHQEVRAKSLARAFAPLILGAGAAAVPRQLGASP